MLEEKAEEEVLVATKEPIGKLKKKAKRINAKRNGDSDSNGDIKKTLAKLLLTARKNLKQSLQNLFYLKKIDHLHQSINLSVKRANISNQALLRTKTNLNIWLKKVKTKKKS